MNKLLAFFVFLSLFLGVCLAYSTKQMGFLSEKVAVLELEKTEFQDILSRCESTYLTCADNSYTIGVKNRELSKEIVRLKKVETKTKVEFIDGKAFVHRMQRWKE